ncbi:hypothetical protein [Mycoplasmopsis alligatoris]|uniref:Uncharacterized protein n=1 Tax=Mycoplasmopsis alligatoris A21JP2 TaxID=747682 RepID=D4XUX1_9BACT|nr:hypothetical protein [Mycoplasmopsis alligatoris]EFF41795.1 hypothetical protein MALL_0125 [Mycoplasmopsis alligatoris A21JP2]
MFLYLPPAVAPHTDTSTTVKNVRKVEEKRKDVSFEAFTKALSKHQEELDYYTKAAATRGLTFEENYYFDALKTKVAKELGFVQPKTRFSTEWWGANLWINFTEEETQEYLKVLDKYFYWIKDVDGILEKTRDIIDHIDTFVTEPKLKLLFQIVKFSSQYVPHVTPYFDREKVAELIKGKVKRISLRLTFGFVPSGLHTGY